MDFIDLLLIAGRSFYSCYRTWPFDVDVEYVYHMFELVKHLVQINSKNYHILINMFDDIVSGYDKYDQISQYVFDLLKINRIVIDDDFITSGKRFINRQYLYKFMLSCIEHNKQFGVLPRSELIKELNINTYHKYDTLKMEQLLSNFKNVDPSD